MVQFSVVDRNGAMHSVEGAEGLSVMEAMRNAGVGEIEALCGGSCSCATCHVFIDDAWVVKLSPADEMESMLVGEAPAANSNSRLSCQISLSQQLNGLRLRVAPLD